MDLLFKRYASPFLLLDTFIENNRFLEFIIEFFNIRNDEMTWDVWLHKVYDQSFEEFKTSIEGIQENKEVTKEQVGTTIKDSKDILINFNPIEKGGE